MISQSYKAWQEHPIATSITTHPINDLDFPVVTVCPPKDSNTALYHDLVHVGNGTLSEDDKAVLKEVVLDVFMAKTHRKYLKDMLCTSYMGNVNQVFQGFHSLPKPFNRRNGLAIKMWNLNGTITSPWFGKDNIEM